MHSRHHYFILYKPFQVLSQFTSEGDKKCLKDFFKVPPTVYPVGRLDFDSEGLLVLTDDKYLNHHLLSPTHQHQREYWVQLEGIASGKEIEKLEAGVMIRQKSGQYKTMPCKAKIFAEPPTLPERIPPVRYRKTVPDSWVRIILQEGKNRQVRKMTAAVGLPTLRLVRYRIEKLTLEKMAPGDMQQITKQELYNLLDIK